MNTNTGGKPRKRGQRKNSLDIPHRFLDRLSPSVLETSRVAQDERASVSPEILTLEGLFKRYYTARQAAGAAERTLEDYQKHMRWFRQFLASEYSGLDNCVPNQDVIRAWISHMLTVQKLMPSTINIRLRMVEVMFNWYALLRPRTERLGQFTLEHVQQSCFSVREPTSKPLAGHSDVRQEPSAEKLKRNGTAQGYKAQEVQNA